MNLILSPSLLAADFTKLGQEVMALENAGINWLHLDVMDGMFVPNITFGAHLVAALRKASNLFFDVHLMIDEPDRYLEAFAKAGADLLVAHVEAARHPQRLLVQIRKFGMKAGIALDPDSDPSRLRWLLPDIDMVLLMGVNPGFSGQKFIPETIEKTRYCRAYLDDHGYRGLPIQVDGGVTPDNAGMLAEAGASILVSGSAFFEHKNYAASKLAFDEATGPAKLGESTLTALEAASLWRPGKTG